MLVYPSEDLLYYAEGSKVKAWQPDQTFEISDYNSKIEKLVVENDNIWVQLKDGSLIKNRDIVATSVVDFDCKGDYFVYIDIGSFVYLNGDKIDLRGISVSICNKGFLLTIRPEGMFYLMQNLIFFSQPCIHAEFTPEGDIISLGSDKCLYYNGKLLEGYTSFQTTSKEWIAWNKSGKIIGSRGETSLGDSISYVAYMGDKLFCADSKGEWKCV